MKKNYDIKLAELNRQYDKNFVVTDDYIHSLPDIKNEHCESFPINLVGVAGIKRPFIIQTKDGNTQEVLATIIGGVDNDAYKRGIDMSIINQELSIFDEKVFNIYQLSDILKSYRNNLDSFTAGLNIGFEYRQWQDALRSKKDDGTSEGGWQYYPVEFEVYMDKFGKIRNIMWVSYIYSSHCPCSTELSYHAIYTRGVAAVPHAQRSIAKIGVEFDDMIWIEDIIAYCRNSVASQVQTFVKRQDEQAMAELCACKGTVFIEDAIRLFADELEKDSRIKDFKIMCLHAESIHPWSTFAVYTKGIKDSLFNSKFTISDMKKLEQYV